MGIQSKLGRWDLTMMVVSFVIGVGIFFTPSSIAAKAGTPFIFYASWVIGGFAAVCGSLTFAEIGARLPAAGGYYRIFSYSYHPAFAFMSNLALVIVNAGSAVIVALVGAEYIQPLIVPDAWYQTFSPDTVKTLLAFTMLTVLFLLNYAGIKMGSRVQNLLSGLKILMILLLCLAVFGNKNPITPGPVATQSAAAVFAAFGLCLVPVFFSFGGYQNTINMGADIKDPQRNMPMAIIGGMLIVAVLYMLINIAYVQVLGFENMKGKSLLASELTKSFFGDKGFKVTSVIVFTSVLGFLNASLMSNPRIFYAMAEDKVLPAVFKKVNPKTQTTAFSLTLFFMIILCTLFLVKDKDQLMNYIIFIDNLALVFAAITIFILRKNMKDAGYSGYRMRLFPLLPVIFIIVLLYVCVTIFRSRQTEALIGLGIFTGAFPLYLLLKKSVK